HCCSGQPPELCCEPILEGRETAATPEQLMRSRYAAFCTRNAVYLLQTWHPDGRHDTSLADLESGCGQQRWCRLQVISAPVVAENADSALVEFVAFFQTADGAPGQLHERSRFVREQGRWFYCDGKLLP